MGTKLNASRSKAALLIVIALLVVFLRANAFAQTSSKVPHRVTPPPTTAPPPPPMLTSSAGLTLTEVRKRAAWQKTLRTAPLPRRGCYKANYPDTDWQRIACTRAPLIPYHHHAGKPGYVVGNSPLLDFSAQLQADTITSAAGSLYSVSQHATESGISGITGSQLANAYSLQLNTNLFDTPLCSGAEPAPGTSCQGWEQFIYANHGSGIGAHLFIQYWLLGYNTKCPSGWMLLDADCYMNVDSDADGTTPAPVLDITQLPDAVLIGAVGPSSDGAILFVGTVAYEVSGNDPLAAEHGWREAEFNIFGDGNFSQAVFSANTTINIRTSAAGMRMTPASCDQISFTGETNNLSLSGVPQVSPPNSGLNWILFAETNGAGMPAGCNTYGGTGLTLELVPGDKFVDWAKDGKGRLTYLSRSGAAMCVVHAPNCGTVGHNGKDHFFPKDLPLPAGAKLHGVLYAAYWPPNLNKTDRGGVGSQGSYGVDADSSIQGTAPQFSVHWQNTCQANPNGNSWRGLNNTYQVSFIISVPNGVNVPGAVPLSSVSGAMCSESDRPPAGTIANSDMGGVADDPITLTKFPVDSGPLPWEATFPAPGLERSSAWSFLKITNTNAFPVFLVNNTRSSSECFQSDAGVLLGPWNTSTDATTNIEGFLDQNSSQYLDLIVCTETGANVPGQVTLSIEHTY